MTGKALYRMVIFYLYIAGFFYNLLKFKWLFSQFLFKFMLNIQKFLLKSWVIQFVLWLRRIKSLCRDIIWLVFLQQLFLKDIFLSFFCCQLILFVTIYWFLPGIIVRRGQIKLRWNPCLFVEIFGFYLMLPGSGVHFTKIKIMKK